MTEQEQKELELFHKWYLDYSHEGNISDRSLTFMEDAWLARAKLDRQKPVSLFLTDSLTIERHP